MATLPLHPPLWPIKRICDQDHVSPSHSSSSFACTLVLAVLRVYLSAHNRISIYWHWLRTNINFQEWLAVLVNFLRLNGKRSWNRGNWESTPSSPGWMNDVYRRIFRPLGINLMFDWVCGRRCLIQKLPLTWKWEASEFHSGARRDAVQLTESFSIRIEDVGKSGVRNKNHITHPPTQQSPVALRWMCVGSRRERDSLYCLVFHSHLISIFFLCR